MANLSNINGKFVVEQTTGYVGVGTTDPNYPIEVLNASAEIALNASGGSIYRVQSDSASNFIIRKEGVGDRLVINSAGNATFAGNVNIGSSLSSEKLEVGGTIRIRVPNTSSASLLLNNTDTQLSIENTGGNMIFTTAGAAEKLRIDTSGNATFAGDVGIGISPNQNFHIFKSDATALIQASNTSGIAQLQFFPRDISNVAHLQSIKGVGSNLTFLTGGNSGNSYVPTERMKIDQFGQIFAFGQMRLELAATETNPIVGTDCAFMFQNTSNTDGNLAVVDFRNSTGFVTGRIGAQFQDAGDRNTDLFFMTRVNGGSLTERMRIQSDGFVRIGNPSATNTYTPAQGYVAGISSPTAGGQTYLSLSMGGSALGNTGVAFGLDAGGASYYMRDNLPIRFYTNNLFAMQISANGNVGIGTTVTNGKLHIADTSSSSTTQYFSAASNTATYSYIKHIDNTVNTSKLTLGTVYGYNVPVDAMTIFNGNVGIGNTAPRDKLTVFTAGAAEEEIGLRLVNPIGFTNIGSGASIIFAQDRNTGENLPMAKIRSAQSIAGTSSYGDLIFSTLSTTMQDRMTILSGGNVGIGTTAPGAKLEVNAQGGGVGGYTGFKLKYGTSSVQSLYMGQITAGNGAFIGTAQYRSVGTWQTEGTAASVISLDAGGNISFATNSGLTANTDYYISERLRITSGGRVYINSNAYSRDAFTMMQGDTSTYVLGLDAPAQYAGLYRYQTFFSGANIAGTITGGNQTSISYNTSSDYRMKKNIKPLEDGLDRVCKLKPVKFDWKLNDESTEGFIAHEVQEIFPYAVTGKKDGEDMQGMDYGRITPLLVKAIQELKADNDSLKARIETLENN